MPELACTAEKVLASGHARLDAQLPGGGWPVGALLEILQERPGRHVWQLLLPALAQLAREQDGPMVLVNAPFEPFAPALDAQGLLHSRLLRIEAAKPPARLWAAEQALRCADVPAVLAWLPQSKGAELRRLHLAAAQFGKLLFVFRPTRVRAESSPARLRLEIEEGESLQLRILKRRGPPLAYPLELPSHPKRLSQLLDSRKAKAPSITATQKDRSHVLDRTVAIA
ncbi:translesion DNA synthesis-associated protein ImuA [Ramlibacter tataouinensis]|uniref:translesion DNA synthesis-associated protein ImuA n=1 Tax=Ramlibacter tataouinensis TaxID=94132 RepID=UPI001D128FB5|nr:translesion DNA synthesis-associated protein ImuA [Ramlibacter tataouinensis]